MAVLQLCLSLHELFMQVIQLAFMLFSHVFYGGLVLLVGGEEPVDLVLVVLQLDPVLVELNLQVGLGLEQLHSA